MQGASAELALDRRVGAAAAGRSRLNAVWRTLRQSPNLLVGGAVTLVLLVIAIAAPLLAPYGPLQLNTGVSLSGPSAAHWLGTDHLGRDILSRVIFGTRISLRVGGASVLLALGLGVPLGLVAGYFGGWLDLLIMRVIDIMLAFPFLIFVLLLIIVLGNGSGNVILAIGVGAIPLFCRLVRATVLSLAQRDYVQAAAATGASHRRIMLRHILPNALSPIIITASLLVAVSVIAEASLSYLGLGTQPPTPSWGLDLNKALGYLEVNLWMALGPGIAILVTATAFNLLGDGLRDVLDPRFRH